MITAMLSLAPPPGAAAHGYKFGAISVGHLWASPAAPDADGVAVYGPLLNRGPSLDSLLGASTPIAESVRFRAVQDGKTRWQKAIDLDPGRPLALAPWRVHLWLSGLKSALKDGDRFDLTLTFAHAGTHSVTVIAEHAAGH